MQSLFNASPPLVIYAPPFIVPCNSVPPGSSTTDQARLFDSADILLMPHGAAAINLHFLPLVSAVVDINTFFDFGRHQAAVIAHMPPPYRVQQFVINKFNVTETEPVVRPVPKNGYFGSDIYIVPRVASAGKKQYEQCPFLCVSLADTMFVP